MLSELRFKNFKSWLEPPAIRLAPITGFFGANSSGKSSILQLLLMLKQTVESPDRAQALVFGDEKTSPANLGSYRDVIHNHDTASELSWSVRWNNPRQVVVKDIYNPTAVLFRSAEMGFDAKVAAPADRPQVVQMAYQLDVNRFTMEKKGTNGEKYDLKSDTPDAPDFRFIRTQGRPWDLPAPVKCYGFPDQVKAYFQNTGFLANLQLAFEELFGRIYYLGPLREYPQRDYKWAGLEPSDMGQRGERVVHAMLAARERKMLISLGRGTPKRSLEEHVAWWLQKLALVDSFSVDQESKGSNNYHVRVKKTPNSAEALITDVGFGVSQILPALVLCYYVPEGSTIIMEQPEIHLHPSVQAGLADVFIDAFRHRGIQIIFESHSEHLLRRLQRRVAEAQLDTSNTAFYFCEMGTNHSTLSELNLDLFGSITNWPKDFFGDQFGEMAAMTRAAVQRKAQED
jgi:predicted ATPase